MLQRELSDSASQDKSFTGVSASALSGRDIGGRNFEEAKGEEGQPFAAAGEDTLITFSPEDQYAQVTLTFMVDSVCLHAAKVEAVQKYYANEARQLQEAGALDAEAAARLAEQASQEEQAISLYAVPKSSKSRKQGDEPDPAQSKRIKERDEGPLPVTNELGVASGKFGWCVSCRAAANLYCKHTRHPVCSFECKQRHIRLLEEAAATEEQSATSRASAGLLQYEEPY